MEPRLNRGFDESGNCVGHVNEVNLRRARLVLGWVTVRRYTGTLTSTQPPIPSAGREMSTGQEAVAVLCGWEGNRRPGVALAMRRKLCDPLGVKWPN